MSRKISENLRVQLFCAVLISLVIGIFIFGISFLVGNTLLDKTVYGHSFADSMADRYFSRLQNFVEDENVSIHNIQRLNAWCNRGEKVYLNIYKDNILIYESYAFSKKNTNLNEQKFDPNMEDMENEYILTLYGDVKVRAFLYYYAGDTFYFWMMVISGLVAFAVFSLCFVMLVSRKVDYITRLKQELDILSGGQLEYPVTIKGKDELGELASGINQMRCSIIKYQEEENKIRLANSELITAMSHDLRTPLTSLLAYLELIERKKYRDKQHMEELVRKSIGQTLRIKQMADKLFSYFLAYATEWETVGREVVDAGEFFQQILEDYACNLENKGMNVETEFTPIFAKMNVNVELLHRALDNLYSNLLKYADPMKCIKISCRCKEKRVFLSMSNGIRAAQIKTESTSIGLITCRRIVEYHEGYFKVIKNDNYFHVTVSLPVQECMYKSE